MPVNQQPMNEKEKKQRERELKSRLAYNGLTMTKAAQILGKKVQFISRVIRGVKGTRGQSVVDFIMGLPFAGENKEDF